MTRQEKVNLLNELLEIEEKNDIGNLTSTDRREFQQWVEELEQEPKTGHWRPIYQGDEIIDYRCSECEFGSTFGKSTHGMNFCPKCGVRMVEPQESEDKG